MASTLKDHEDICKERYDKIKQSLHRLESKSKENTKAIQGIEKQLATGSGSIKALAYITSLLGLVYLVMRVFK
tara:strand:+ start:393 stop:611 length:219 start_codon:yes stop_codon:yes gene_type:complete